MRSYINLITYLFKISFISRSIISLFPGQVFPLKPARGKLVVVAFDKYINSLDQFFRPYLYYLLRKILDHWQGRMKPTGNKFVNISNKILFLLL